MTERVAVRKTYKLFVNGAFIRSESGRTDPVGGENVVRGSRKDMRDAVVAARAGHEKWAGQTAANRGLVLYRLAEMMEARSGNLAQQLVTGGTCDAVEAAREVEAAIDRTVWYAGWCDKYLALASSRNPVAGPHLNLSTPEATGIVAVIAPDEPALLGLVTLIVPALVSGNAVIAIPSERDPRTAIVFAECLATSDLPNGACNIITGLRKELGIAAASHMDINALCAALPDRAFEKTLGEAAAETVMRTRFEDAGSRAGWFDERNNDLDRVTQSTELKTVWHPARI